MKEGLYEGRKEGLSTSFENFVKLENEEEEEGGWKKKEKGRRKRKEMGRK